MINIISYDVVVWEYQLLIRITEDYWVLTNILVIIFFGKK